MNDPNEIINRLRELYRKKEYLGFYKSFMLSRFLLPKDISEKMETSAGYSNSFRQALCNEPRGC